MEMPLTEEEFKAAEHKWKNLGLMVQHAFPTLSVVQREFLMTGASAEEQARIFGDPEDDTEEDPFDLPVH